MWIVTICCAGCGCQETFEVQDSIPYCPKCGKPITPDEITA